MASREEAKARRRQQILDAAMLCFMRDGYHLATTEDIAAACGVSKGTLYWYFDSKKEIILALAALVMGRVEHEWQASVGQPGSTATEKLRRNMALFRVEFEELASFFGIIMEAWALTRHDEEVQEIVRATYEPFLAIMAGIIQDGIESGEFKAASARATALTIITLYDGLTLARGLLLVDEDWRQVIDATEALIFHGLGAKSGG